MTNTIKEVLEFVRENDVKFIRLTFCDLFGTQKNISIMPDQLPYAFAHGISFDASAIAGFSDVINSDLLLFPDPVTLHVLPWRPQQGRVMRFYCNIKHPDGSDFAKDTRAILQNAVNRCESMGYLCKIGAECEFYLFQTDENGEPTRKTLDNGGYFDIAPLDKGEDIRREICLCLEQMGINPETSHHEQGPGQNEIDFKASDPLTSADNLLTFQSMVKAIAARNGLYASFMPKPIQNKSGSGLHVNLSLTQNGANIFKSNPQERSKAAESFIAGILAKTQEMTLFLNPIVNSYERLGSFEAPKYISWSHQNRSQLIRIPAASGDKSRMEMRSPDPSLNPYLAFALLIHAGLDGIQAGLHLPNPCNVNLYTAEESIVNDLTMLPCDLEQAIQLAQVSEFVKTTIGEQAQTDFILAKKQEALDFAKAKDKDRFYEERYFKRL